jgi:hypothetical protein
MPSGKTRVAVFALIGLTALLVGFQGASTLMTLTQIGASPGKPSVPKAHASLVPRPAIPLEVSEPARIPAADVHAATPTQAAAPTSNVQPVIEADPVAPSAADTVAAPTSNLADLAAAATAQAQLVEAPAFIEEAPPRRERRRYRAVRPDLHRVY